MKARAQVPSVASGEESFPSSSGLRWSQGFPSHGSSPAVSALIFICLSSLCISSSWKDTNQIKLGPSYDLIFPDYVCKDLVSERGHIPRFQGVGTSTYPFGNTMQSLTQRDQTEELEA